jgi:hypothetical protein
VLSLARLWWREPFATFEEGPLVDFEIGRQALYLSKTWNPTTKQVLVGVGDQLDPEGDLLTYQDFGIAPFALQVRNRLKTAGSHEIACSVS